MKKIMNSCLLSLLVTACGGGGSNNTASPAPRPAISSTLPVPIEQAGGDPAIYAPAVYIPQQSSEDPVGIYLMIQSGAADSTYVASGLNTASHQFESRSLVHVELDTGGQPIVVDGCDRSVVGRLLEPPLSFTQATPSIPYFTAPYAAHLQVIPINPDTHGNFQTNQDNYLWWYVPGASDDIYINGNISLVRIHANDNSWNPHISILVGNQLVERDVSCFRQWQATNEYAHSSVMGVRKTTERHIDLRSADGAVNLRYSIASEDPTTQGYPTTYNFSFDLSSSAGFVEYKNNSIKSFDDTADLVQSIIENDSFGYKISGQIAPVAQRTYPAGQIDPAQGGFLAGSSAMSYIIDIDFK